MPVDFKCIVFIRGGSIRCNIICDILKEVCHKNDIDLVIANASDKEYEKEIKEYNIGTLPCYLFIKDGKTICRFKGLNKRAFLNKEIKNELENVKDA